MTTSSKKTSSSDSSSMVNAIAKLFDPNVLQYRWPSNEDGPSTVPNFSCESVFDMKVSSLDQKIDKLLSTQGDVLHKLEDVSKEICCMEKDIEMLKTKRNVSDSSVAMFEKSSSTDLKMLCMEIKSKLTNLNKSDEEQANRIDGLEQIVLGIQQFLFCLAEKLTPFKLNDLCRDEAPPKLLKVGGYLRKDKAGNLFRMQTFSDDAQNDALLSKRSEKEKSHLTEKGTKSFKKKRPPDCSDEAAEKTEVHSVIEKIHKLNKENTETASAILAERSSPKSRTPESKQNVGESPTHPWKNSLQKTTGKTQGEVNRGQGKSQKISVQDTKSCYPALIKKHKEHKESQEETQENVEGKIASGDDGLGHISESTSESEDTTEETDGPSKSQGQDVNHKQKPPFPLKDEQMISSKRRGNDEGLTKDINKKSRVDARGGQKPEKGTMANSVKKTISPEKTEGSVSVANKSKKTQEACIKDKKVKIDDSPPPPAPFDHRVVSAKKAGIHSYYHIHRGDVLGGGRFGQVHKCEEKGTGLKLAAKIIKARTVKEKDEVKNEINVMNQLNHVNLIQLYDAFESKSDVILIMEYVEGGELFDRIIDENCNLTEMDTILFIKQICEGVQYMHQMYVLHLDLKPENILCVNREANKIKIIDFGLARRYKPREKLKVNFGTPEFLAPEVVNYDFVSFPTDMWSIGVISYMLLSGLSPFLGDNDNETLNNILACRWDFDDEEFEKVSEEAKDFITKLLVKEKSWRISATAALKHPWLSDQALHCKLQAQRKARTHAPVVP